LQAPHLVETQQAFVKFGMAWVYLDDGVFLLLFAAVVTGALAVSSSFLKNGGCVTVLTLAYPRS